MKLLCNKQKLLLLLLTTLFCMVLLSGCYLFPEEEEVLAPPVKITKVVYNTSDVKKGDIEDSVECRGRVISEEQISLSFEHHGGYLKKVYKRFGEKVLEGELLAELDSDNLENEVEIQKIIFNNAKNTYDQILKTGDIDVKLAEMDLERLQNEYQNMKATGSAYEPSEIKDMEYNIKKQEIRVAKYKVQYQDNIDRDKNNLKIEQIKLDNLLLNLEKAKLYAPISGEINYKSDIPEGEYVQPRKKFIMIADNDKLLLEYSGDKSSKFAKGMEVEVDIDNKKYTGTVIITPREVPFEEYEKYKDTVKFQVDDMPKGINIGQQLQIKAILDKHEDVIVVPKKVVHNYKGSKYVKVLENGIPTDRDVKVGIESATEYEIVEGLEVGDKVLK